MGLYLPASSNLIRLRTYLDRFPRSQQPAAYEFLTAVAMHRVFDVPLQCGDTDDPSVKYRMLWNGHFDAATNIFQPSPSGVDSICFAYGFCLLVENTLRGNVGSQWRREFVESIDHYDKFVEARALEKKDVYLLFVAPDFHQSTYNGFRQKAIEGYSAVLLDNPCLWRWCNICRTLATYRHLDLKQLLRSMVETFKTSASLATFKKGIKRCMTNWETDLLRQERTAYFGLKSYEAMRAVGRRTVGTADIMRNLKRDKDFERYYKVLGGGDLTQYIRDGLVSERLAKVIATPDEDLFCCVECCDFKSRGLRLIKAVDALENSS